MKTFTLSLSQYLGSLAHPADVDAAVGDDGLLEVEVVLFYDGHVVDEVGARPPLRRPPRVPRDAPRRQRRDPLARHERPLHEGDGAVAVAAAPPAVVVLVVGVVFLGEELDLAIEV